jgi:predicted nucleotidyltransferase
MHPKVENIAAKFTERIRQIFGDDLVSVILYGSSMTGDYHPKKSDVNFLVVLTPDGIGKIRKVQPAVNEWKRNRILFPLFMTREYIADSQDSFPVEFFNMQQAYRVLAGEDVLAGLKIRKSDLRLQCERELKGKLLHLRQEYVFTKGNPKAIRTLIGQSIVTFSSLFRALLFLDGRPIPKIREEVLNDACSEFHLDLALFQNLIAIRQKGITYTKLELVHFMERYITEIERLCYNVDQIKTA